MLMVFWPLVLTRWIHFACVFVMFGCSFFWLYAGKTRLSRSPGGLPHTLRNTNILLRIATPLAAISGVIWLVLVLVNMTHNFDSATDPEDLELFFFETPFGTVSFIRLALLTMSLAIAYLPWNGRWRFATLAFVSGLLLISQAWFGHSNDGKGLYRDTMIATYAIHMIAAAAWAGGLPALLFSVIEQCRFGTKPAVRENTLDICSRYSLMAMSAVFLVVLSGIANTAFRVEGSFLKLFDNDYGDMLFKKLVIVAAMLAVAGFNRFIAMPRLQVASSKGTAPISWLRYSLTLDIILGVLVLGASAVLGLTMPPM